MTLDNFVAVQIFKLRFGNREVFRSATWARLLIAGQLECVGVRVIVTTAYPSGPTVAEKMSIHRNPAPVAKNCSPRENMAATSLLLK